MIILEGPDGSGKTTLAKRLSEELGYPIARKVVTSEMVPVVNLRQWVDDNLSEGFQRVIFDRHRLISEPIYSGVFRSRELDPEFWDFSWLEHAVERLHAIDPLVIYCLPSLTAVRKNTQHDPDNTAVKGEIDAIYRAYFVKMLDDEHCLRYNYEQDDLSEFINHIRRITRNMG